MKNPTRILDFLRSPRFPIFMIVFTDVLGLGITIPVLPLFAKNELGAQAWQITTLTSVYFAAQFLAGPLLGRLSDRYGRRPVLIASQAGTFSALLLTAFAPGIWLIYLARLVDGVTGGNISVAQAYLSDITTEKDRARGLGLVNASFGLGFVFGPAFGSLLAANFGPRLPFYAAAVVSLLTISLSTFLLPESLSPAHRRLESSDGPRHTAYDLEIVRQPGVGLLLLVAALSSLGFFAFQTTYVLWVERLVLPTWEQNAVQQGIGAILTLVGLVGITTQFWLVGPAIRRFGERHLVVFGYAARGLAFGVMALYPTLVVVILAAPLLSVGGGLAQPALIALLTFTAPPGQRGRVIGLNQSSAALGNIVGPILSGFLFDAVHPNASMIASCLLMGIAVLVALRIYRLPVKLQTN